MNRLVYFSHDRSKDPLPVRPSLCRPAQDHAAQVRFGRRQALHADVRVFQFHGPPPRGGLHCAGLAGPSLWLLVHLSGGRSLLKETKKLQNSMINFCFCLLVSCTLSLSFFFYMNINNLFSLSLKTCRFNEECLSNPSILLRVSFFIFFFQ